MGTETTTKPPTPAQLEARKNLRPWRPGESGNPEGSSERTRERKRKRVEAWHVIQKAREMTDDTLRELAAMSKDPEVRADVRLESLRTILSYAWGPPVEQGFPVWLSAQDMTQGGDGEPPREMTPEEAEAQCEGATT